MGTNRKFLWELRVISPFWWSKTCLHSPWLFCFQMQPYVILHGSVSFPRLWVDKTAVILICPVMRVLCLAISHLCGMNRRQIHLCKIKRRKISSNHFRTVPGTAVTQPQLQCFSVLARCMCSSGSRAPAHAVGHANHWEDLVSGRIEFQFVRCCFSLSSWIIFLITSLLFPLFFFSSAVHPIFPPDYKPSDIRTPQWNQKALQGCFNQLPELSKSYLQ